MTAFQLCIDLPFPELEPGFDWSMIDLSQFSDYREVNIEDVANKFDGVANSSLLISYACRRDYLSVPKTFSIVQFWGSEVQPISYQVMPSIEFFNHYASELQLDNGLYTSSIDNECKMLLVDPLRVLEVVYDQRLLQSHIYHVSDSTRAIADYLSKN